jgi:hypothetical protein
VLHGTHVIIDRRSAETTKKMGAVSAVGNGYDIALDTFGDTDADAD